MQNIIQVTEHIRNKLVASKSDDIERRVLSLIL